MDKKFTLPKITLLKVRKIIFLVFGAAILFGGGYYVGLKNLQLNLQKFPKVTVSRTLPPDKTDLNFSLFWEVWDMLSQRYYDKTKLNPGQMIYGAISGMVSALGDPYTVFLAPSQNKVVEEDLSGSFEGVGIQIGFKGNQLAVVAPLPDSPAQKVGVLAGDFIIGIKDDAKKIEMGTVGINLSEAVQAIRGPSGSVVTLTLIREGSEKPFVLDIVRAKLSVPSVSLEYVGPEKNIARIRLMKFGAETMGEWESKVTEVVKNKEIKGLILDLRNNPGGYMQGAVEIGGDFFKAGTTVVVEERAGSLKKEYKTENRLPRLLNIPVVVLVNGGSASASEILAGALRDQNQTKLVGDITFGKGTIQEPDDLPGGAGLHITIAKWLTPSGFWVNEKGLEPDVEIKDNPETTEDEQLLEALKQFN